MHGKWGGMSTVYLSLESLVDMRAKLLSTRQELAVSPRE